MGEFGDALRAEMAAAGFRDMDAVRRYRFIAEFVMRRQAGAIEAARRRRERERTAYYLSAEFLLGRIVGDALRNLGVYEETAEAMAAYAARKDVRRVHLLPFHPLARSKYEQMGREYPFPNRFLTAEEQQRLLDIWRRFCPETELKG